MPGDAEAQNNFANTLVTARRPADALLHYDGAVRARPESSAMRLNYAAALGQTGRMADVITQFSAAEQLGPLGAEALGPLVLRSRRPAGLTTQSRVTNVRSSSHPARPPRTTTTAFCSRACDAPVRAPSTCAAALRTDAAIVAARVNLANILLLSGKTSEAISEYAIAERLRPDDAQIGANLARARALR